MDEDGTAEIDQQTEINRDKNKNTGALITGQDQIKRGGFDGIKPPSAGTGIPHQPNSNTWYWWTCCNYNNPSTATGSGSGSCCDGGGGGDCCECDGCGDCNCGDCDCSGCDCSGIDCAGC